MIAKTVKYLFSFFLSILFTTAIYAQTEQATVIDLASLEKTINQLCDSIQKAKSDEVRIAANDSLKQLFKIVLADEASFNYQYKTIDKVSIITSDDKKLRLYTWVLPAKDGSTYKYNGFAQFKKSNKHAIRFFKFTEKTLADNELAEKEKTTNTDWYGAVYYKIIDTGKKKKRYYTLLGWHGNNLKTTTKIIDVLQPRTKYLSFGKPVFKGNEGTLSRVIFEYNFRVSMLLRYQIKKNRIVFDNISPNDSNFKGNYANYGPDLSVNAYNYKKGKWYFEKDVDARNDFKDSGKTPTNIKPRGIYKSREKP